VYQVVVISCCVYIVLYHSFFLVVVIILFFLLISYVIISSDSDFFLSSVNQNWGSVGVKRHYCWRVYQVVGILLRYRMVCRILRFVARHGSELLERDCLGTERNGYLRIVGESFVLDKAVVGESMVKVSKRSVVEFFVVETVRKLR